ncbi:MAG: methionine adenosyltransferase [Pseudomonadota bacterium]|nr:methionine adenosyltransferase [Pseudomonadota bacterium]
MSEDFIFTSESVTIGHPDKLCDQVSDSVVDHFLRQDPDARIIAECAVASGVMFISTHYASQAKVDISEIARRVIRNVGYPKEVFDAEACTILSSFMDHTATDYTPFDLADMDDAAIDAIPNRQQVSVFGYACDQTPNLIPLPISLAHRLADRLDSEKVAKKLPYLLPDGETQVGIEFRDGRPCRIHSITLVATQTAASEADLQRLREDVQAHVIDPVLENEQIKPDAGTRVFINPAGARVGGGPSAHSGLTGRKTGIDTYGEFARHSGAALSGKDPMRIDRVGAYAARYAAKNVVAAGMARECEVQLSYTIGVARPVSLRVRTFGTGKVGERELASRLEAAIDFRLGGIVRDLGLKSLSSGKEGFYRRLAVYGHMGREDFDVPWERTDKVDALK